MVHGGMTLVKYLLFLFNFIFWLSGIAIIVTGAVIQIKYTYYMNFLGNTFLAAPVVLIVVGCVIAVLGFFGCCGAIRENYCMTMTFAVLLGLIFFAELGAGIASYALKSDVKNIIMDHTKSGMNHYNHSDYGLVTTAWDRMQKNFNCCGADNYTDWKNISLSGKPNGDLNGVPQSCCKLPFRKQNCGAGFADVEEKEAELKINTIGCVPPLEKFALEKIYIIGGVGVGVAIIQVLGVCFACCLAKSILREYEDYYY